MKTVRSLLLDPATGRYEDLVLEGADEDAVRNVMAQALQARHLVPLDMREDGADGIALVAWSDLEARFKEQTCCWTRAVSELGVPGRAVFTGMVDGVTVDVPFDRHELSERITTYVAILEFPRPGAEPVFETTFQSAMKRTRQG